MADITNASAPVPVSGLAGAAAIAAGGSHSCALLAAGTVDCWGANSSGELGNGTTTNASTPVHVGVATAPTNVTATAGTGSATVSWTAPSSNNGSPISGYVITPYVGQTALPPRRYDSTALRETVTGLQKGQMYRFKVAAINAWGDGPDSVSSNAVAPK